MFQIRSQSIPENNIKSYLGEPMELETIADMMPEREWFAYVEKGQGIKVDELLLRLGEGNICLSSGEMPTDLVTAGGDKASSFDLIDYPIDFNTGNILPSNMATVNRDLLKPPFKPFGYKQEIGGLTIEMVTDELLYDHNQEYLNPDWEGVFTNVEKGDLIGVWDFLTRNHIKGIIRIENDGFFLTVIEALGYFQRKIQEINSGPKLGLV